MKVLVTGATGFIGNYVVREILKMNHEVIATSIDEIEKAKNFDWFDNVRYIWCDLNENKENYFEFFGKPDLMIHLSWQGLPNYKELFHIEKNLPLNYNFIKNMVKNGLKDLVVTGTCSEYGLREGCVKEDMITNPMSSYALAKDTLRKFIQQLKKKIDFDFKWIRIFYLYGKGQTPKSILSQLDTALENKKEVFNMSGGEQLRDYLPVEKVAEYITKISLQNKINGIINCCSGKPISIGKLVENYLKQKNQKIKLNFGYYPYSPDEPMEFWGDNTKLKSIIKNK